MNILILYSHFWPDSPPYASMLRSISEKLVVEGHSVTVVCQQPSYKESDSKVTLGRRESLNGVEVHRLNRLPFWLRFGKLRALSKLAFPLRSYFFCRRNFPSKQFDLVWTATIPPVISGVIGRRLASRYSAKFLYHCQDLYPEIAVHMRMIKAGSFIHRLANRWEIRTREAADILVSLSQDMKTTIEAVATPMGTHIVLNNFSLEDFSDSSDSHVFLESERSVFTDVDSIKVIFAGNIGQFQGLENIAKGLISLGVRGKAIQLVFVGEGNVLPNIKKICANASNISFVPHQPYEIARHMISDADYGLVSLEPGIYQFAYPSKTLTYLGLSVALAVVVEPESKLVAEIKEHGIGYYSEDDSPEKIAKMFSTIIDGKSKIKEHKCNANRHYINHCARNIVLSKWANIISNLEKGLG